MARDFASQMKRIEKKLQEKANEIMEDKIATEVIKEGQTQVVEEVYNKYTPVPTEYGGYERTYKLLTGWDVEKVENGIKVRNNREEDGKYIPEIIETGEGYEYGDGTKGFEKPRPFIQRTKEELKKKGIFEKTMKRELGKYVKIK